MKATLKNYRQSPQKVRLVANLIRGKSVPQARAALSFLSKKSSPAIGKLLDSAVANARMQGGSADSLMIKTITVDKGMVMRRGRPFARGRSGIIQKTMSTIRLELAPTPTVKPKASAKSRTKKSSPKREPKT